MVFYTKKKPKLFASTHKAKRMSYWIPNINIFMQLYSVCIVQAEHECFERKKLTQILIFKPCKMTDYIWNNNDIFVSELPIIWHIIKWDFRLNYDKRGR